MNGLLCLAIIILSQKLPHGLIPPILKNVALYNIKDAVLNIKRRQNFASFGTPIIIIHCIDCRGNYGSVKLINNKNITSRSEKDIINMIRMVYKLVQIRYDQHTNMWKYNTFVVKLLQFFDHLDYINMCLYAHKTRDDGNCSIYLINSLLHTPQFYCLCNENK